MMIVTTFYHIMLPILIPIGIGALLHKKFTFDLKSFSKLFLYYYVPALAFVKIYTAKLTIGLVLSVFSFLILQFILLVIVGAIISKVFGYSRQRSASFSNSICLTNNGNVGIPINAMAFHHDPFAMAIQVMVVVFELFVTFTFGIVNASKAASNLKSSLLQFAKMPVLYAILGGALFNYLHIPIPAPILTPLNTIADGMLAFALISIGAQIASSQYTSNTSLVLLSSCVRLMLSPLLAFFVIHFLQLSGITAEALFIASAIPTSRNSAALALEYDNEPGFASQAVLMSMVLSSITLPIIIHLSQSLF